MGASGRGSGAATRSPVVALIVVLGLGLALRLIIAYVLLPGAGFGVDRASFTAWANELAQHGPFGFYGRGFFIDYTPGYLYVLWLVGIVGQWLGGIGELIKLPAIVADVAVGWLAASLVRELGGSRRAALFAALLFVVNPVSWFDSAIWGQVDSFGLIFLLLAVRETWRDRPERATVLAAVAAIVKPQLGILVPILAVVLLRRYLVLPLLARRRAAEPSRSPGSGDSPTAPGVEQPARWKGRSPVRLLTSGIAGLGTAVALCLPFGLSIPDLLGQVGKTAGGYPYLTVNAYNPWALFSRDGNGLAAAGNWLRDVAGDKPGEVATLVLGIPALYVGTALLLLAIGAVCAVVARRDDRWTILLGVTVLAMVFFVVPTRVHERYLYPFFALGAILAAGSFRWRLAYLALAVANFLNLYAVLTLPFYKNPRIEDWLGIAGAVRSLAGVAAIALVHLAVLVWAATELRPGAGRRLEADALADAADEAAADEAADGSPADGARATGERARPEPSGPAAAIAVRATVGAVLGRAGRGPAALGGAARGPGPIAQAAPIAGPGPFDDARHAWPQDRRTLGERIRRALHASPRLSDRTRVLHGEPGGRLDRLDLLAVIVLVVGVLTMRTFRLSEPQQFHFDEVYHARTAMEFLQDWRYGMKHDIYEYTHPHLAKYAIAVGLMAWGDDRTTGQTDLGVPISDALVEPRWDDPSLPAARAGDRFYVATGSEVRAYDLASRRLVASIPLPGARALALDAVGHRVFVGSDDGSVSVIETATTLDLLRTATQVAAGPSASAAPFATLGAPVERLFVTSDGSALVAVAKGELISIDPSSGALGGRLALAGIGDIADGGTGDALVADPTQVTDPTAAAATIAALIGGDSGTYALRLKAALGGGTPAGSAIPIAGSIPLDRADALDRAITDGRLPGLSVRALPLLAVADRSGVSFVEPTTATLVQTIALDAAATGIANVPDIDGPKVYVAEGGSRMAVIKLGAAGAKVGAPSLFTSFAMPGPVRRVTYDNASSMVHVLGDRPGGSGQTVYVIEPHGNAVYADAPVPFTVVAWATDVNQRYPSLDRQQLLVASADGTLGTVDIGSHSFAWRLPGVLAGALTGALLYLLARILFRRRSVAVGVGLVVLLDGMLFVQSRIAMNDVYVGLFIAAAYALFAALWTGRLRGWAPFWLLMPVVGGLLGLALASKWVALYAIAGIGILILGRSALGRIVTILGLVAGSALLGYLALIVPKDAATSGGNLVFIGLMIALTIAATLVTVLRPIAWSAEEIRLAIGGPAAAGIGIFGLAVAAGAAERKLALGPVSMTPIEIALALVIGSVVVWGILRAAGAWGLGPLAAPPDPDDPLALVERAASPPEGWLRPGALGGLPLVWLAVSLLAIPVVVYVVSYLPWVALGNRLTEGWPPGNTGKTLLQLTADMYRYHNDLRATHAASSPYWAWPLDLKPVWFYQGSFAGNTAAAIYDHGNLVLWWLGIPALAFAAWQAFKRRSLALGLVTVGFALQWIPWSRIDRVTFQYHEYAGLPFVTLALGYFLAELWHGTSRRVWLVARLVAAGMLMLPALLWLFKAPLCAFVRVTAANPGSAACQTTAPGTLLVTTQVAGIAIVLIGAGVLLVGQLLALGRPTLTPAETTRRLVALSVTMLGAIGALVIVRALLPASPLVSLQGFSTEPIAALVLVVLAPFAWVIATARDARRFTAGLVAAAAIWFIVFYPNISALPLPAAWVNTYQGLLPTWLYAFQFPVNTDPAVQGVKLIDLGSIGLFGLVGATCLIVGYSAWTWRIASAGSRALDASAAPDAPAALDASAAPGPIRTDVGTGDR